MKKIVFNTVVFLPVLFVAREIVVCDLGYSKSKLHISVCEMKLKWGEHKQSPSLVCPFVLGKYLGKTEVQAAQLFKV